MNTPLVSIIVPTYNRAHLIGETLDSVLAQTYTNWECIVVDDGSTDDTEAFLKFYCEKDARFQYQHRPSNRLKGGNACRNYGFELSKGEYVNWFDDDDVMKPNKLKIQIQELHNSSYDFTICQTMMFDVANNKEVGLRATSLISENVFEDYILFKSFWLIEAPLWKKEFLTKNKLIFDEKLVQRQDYDFHMRVLDISTNYFANISPLVFVKMHVGRMSNSGNDNPNKIFSNAKVKSNILSKYREKLSCHIICNVYSELLDLYKFSIRNRQFINAFYIFKSLLLNIDFLDLSFVKKIKYLTKLIFSFFSFLLFSKGDNFLNFSKFINNKNML